MKTLVVGATGLLGTEICLRLTAAGHLVRALVRPTADPGKRAALTAMGVELVEGDLKDAGSLDRATDGVQAVISTASSVHSHQPGDSIETVDQKGQVALIDSARQAGVERFVFVSFRENPGIQFPLSVAKRTVERALKSSGMTYTILQASYFMEVWLTPALGFDAVNGKVRLYGDGSRPVSWISYRDVARAAVAAVTEGTARNMVVELGGPRLDESALQSRMREATDPLQKSFAGLMLQCAAGDAIDPATSTRLFPFHRTSVSDFITAQLAAPGS